MTARPTAPAESRAPEPDWVEQMLLRDAADHGAEYIADNGFTARVMQELPPAGDALPACATACIGGRLAPSCPQA